MPPTDVENAEKYHAADAFAPPAGAVEQTPTHTVDLENRIRDQFKTVMGGDSPEELDDDKQDDPTDEPESEDEQDDPTDEPEDEADADSEDEPEGDPKDEADADSEDESEDEPEDKDDETTEGAAPAEADSTLPAAYRRSLKSREWSDAEIDSFYKADPVQAMKTFDRIHASRVAEIQQFSRLGREVKAKEEQDSSKTPAVEMPEGGLAAIDEDKLVAEYGNEDVVRAIVGPVNAAIAGINSVLPDIRDGAASAQQARNDVLARQIEGFFSADDMDPYREVYGSAAKGLSEGQMEKRQRVLEEADALVTGAAHQGRQLAVSDALVAAHDMVSADYKTKAVRRSLKKTVKARAKGKTLRPTSRGRGGANARPSTRSDLERSVGQKLKAFTSTL